MRMEKVLEEQMGCEMCFLKNPLPWVAVLAIPLLIFAGFWGFGFLSIFLTSSALILSTVLFSSSKSKPQLQDEEVEEKDEVLPRPSHQESSADHMVHLVSDPQPESESTTQEKSNQDDADFILRSSESESLGHSSTSEDSEAEWIFRDNVDHSPDWSDGSISDEESLIEIALPSGHYVDHSNKFINLQQRMLQDLAPQPLFQQHSLMELLAEINEMNEEDNLIEIDVSMGSIKCSRFEIQA